MHARVIANFGHNLAARTLDGEIISCLTHKRLGLIVCGDNIEYTRQSDGSNIIRAVSRRMSELNRPDRQGNLKPIAANLHQIIVVLAPQPAPDWLMLTNYQLYATRHQLDTALVLNKSDLVTESRRKELMGNLDIFKSLGVQTVLSCCKSGKGLDNLLSVFKNKTSILVGQSGVGKSSIVKVLLPDQNIQTRAICQVTGLGSHTTTATTLYQVSKNGELIDSPGVRQFSIEYLDADTVRQNFIEFGKYQEQCKFNNCTHLHEPGCSVREAAENNSISALRWQHYRQLMEKCNA